MPAFGHVTSDRKRGDLFEQHVIRRVEFEGDTVIVDLLDRALLAAHSHPRLSGRVEVLVPVEVLEPEHDVVSAKRLAV